MVFRNFSVAVAIWATWASFSLSLPKKAKFSGYPINSAPWCTANSSKSSASSRFFARSGLLVIWIAAAK